MNRLGAVNDILFTVGEAMEHKRLEIRAAATAAALSAANSTEKVAALIESIRAKNSTFGHTAAEALHSLPNFHDMRASLAASRANAAKKAKEMAEAAGLEWQKVRVKTAAAADHVAEQAILSLEGSRERMRELASFRQLSEQLWELQKQTLGNSTMELRMAANQQIVSVIQRLKRQNTTFASKAAEALSDAMQVGGEVSAVPMLLFVISAMICLAGSALCHTYFMLSYQYNVMMSKLDFTGITCLIAGSFMPVIVYGLHCHPISKRIYLVVITLLSLLCLRVVTAECYVDVKYDKFRVALFVGLGCFAVLPLGQHYYLYGMTDMLRNVIFMCGLYLLGTLFYVAKVPERWWPGCFDYIGGSHLIWHILVLSAALVHYRGSMLAYSQVVDLEEMHGESCG